MIACHYAGITLVNSEIGQVYVLNGAILMIYLSQMVITSDVGCLKASKYSIRSIIIKRPRWLSFQKSIDPPNAKVCDYDYAKKLKKFVKSYL